MPTESEIRDVVRRIVENLMPSESPAAAAETEAVEPAQPSTERPTIAIGGDHGGYPLKERIGFQLREAGYAVVDCGTHSGDSVDYPDYAHAVAEKVAGGEATYGIVIDGAGIGSAMAANKVPGIRAALCYDLSSARNSREHNHANVLSLGARLIGDGLAWHIVETWLATPWGPGRHADRIQKITEIEQRYMRERG